MKGNTFIRNLQFKFHGNPIIFQGVMNIKPIYFRFLDQFWAVLGTLEISHQALTISIVFTILTMRTDSSKICKQCEPMRITVYSLRIFAIDSYFITLLLPAVCATLKTAYRIEATKCLGNKFFQAFVMLKIPK